MYELNQIIILLNENDVQFNKHSMMMISLSFLKLFDGNLSDINAYNKI